MRLTRFFFFSKKRREAEFCPVLWGWSMLKRTGALPFFFLGGAPWGSLPRAAPAALLDALVVMLGEKLGETSSVQLDRLYRLKEHYKTEIPR